MRNGCADRGIKHDLNRFSTLFLSRLELGDYRLALSHDLSHVRNEVLNQEFTEAIGRSLGCWLKLQELSATGSLGHANVGRNRRHLVIVASAIHEAGTLLNPRAQADKANSILRILLPGSYLYSKHMERGFLVRREHRYWRNLVSALQRDGLYLEDGFEASYFQSRLL